MLETFDKGVAYLNRCEYLLNDFEKPHSDNVKSETSVATEAFESTVQRQPQHWFSSVAAFGMREKGPLRFCANWWFSCKNKMSCPSGHRPPTS